jgi:hypothetical protein
VNQKQILRDAEMMALLSGYVDSAMSRHAQPQQIRTRSRSATLSWKAKGWRKVGYGLLTVPRYTDAAWC